MSDREKEILEGQDDTEGAGGRIPPVGNTEEDVEGAGGRIPPVGNTEEDVEGQERGSNG